MDSNYTRSVGLADIPPVLFLSQAHKLDPLYRQAGKPVTLTLPDQALSVTLLDRSKPVVSMTSLWEARGFLKPSSVIDGTGAGSGTIGSDNVVVAGLPVHTQFFGKPTTPENTTRFKLVPTFALTGAVTDVEGDLNGRLQLELWV